ncbi:preprotein translocase subunit SecE [Paracoccus sp. (in: a-proteobacteria)]|uniref:preprotein translocase subunit SecE n=1 Tax=Paracoccus sp. TaxID=267 RepID=UPI0032203D71
MANPVQFISQVRSEIGKIVWPNRREVVTTTIMVFIMATLAAIFFFLADLLIKTGIAAVINAVGS